MNIFDDMVSPLNKERFLDWEQRKPGSRKDEFTAVSGYIGSEEFDEGAIALSRGEYWLDAPVRKMIHKWNTTRKRVAYLFPDEERFLLRYLSFLLHRYDDAFSPKVYSYCSGRQLPRAVKELRHKVRFGEDSVYQLDIASYGISIDPERLVPLLREVIADDPMLCRFFESLLLRQQIYLDGELVHEPTGALPGISPNAFFCNVYLDKVDREFEDQAKFYFRYADDVLMVLPTQTEALRLGGAYASRMEELGLSLNQEKTGIHLPGEPWTYLGLLFFDHGEIDISPVTLKKMKARIRRKARKLRRRAIQRSTDLNDAVRSFLFQLNLVFFGDGKSQRIDYAKRYFPIVTQADSFEELDHYVQTYARYILTGRFTKKNYNLRYSDLKAMGYRSLVHEYYQTRALSK